MKISDVLGDSRFDGACIPNSRLAFEHELEEIRGRHELSIRKTMPWYDLAYCLPRELEEKVDQAILAMATDLLTTLLHRSFDFTFSSGSGNAADYADFAKGAHGRLRTLMHEDRATFHLDESPFGRGEFAILELDCELDRILEEMVTRAWSAHTANFQCKAVGQLGTGLPVDAKVRPETEQKQRAHTINEKTLSDAPDALARKVIPIRRTPDYPKRATWLKDRLQERYWNEHDLFRQGGPDHKTTQKILKGFAVREDVLEKVTKALSTKHASVSVLDIPRD